VRFHYQYGWKSRPIGIRIAQAGKRKSDPLVGEREGGERKIESERVRERLRV
jgi:hypothetical protein